MHFNNSVRELFRFMGYLWLFVLPLMLDVSQYLPTMYYVLRIPMVISQRFVGGFIMFCSTLTFCPILSILILLLLYHRRGYRNFFSKVRNFKKTQGGPKLNFRQCQHKKKGLHYILKISGVRGGPRYPPLYPRLYQIYVDLFIC